MQADGPETSKIKSIERTFKWRLPVDPAFDILFMSAGNEVASLAGRNGVTHAQEHGTPSNANAEAILDAAEKLFAYRGFSAVSMRMIATESGQHLASANYYFGSKAGLFEAAFLRRIVPVNRRRIELLDGIQAAGPLTIEAVVHAYLSPLFEDGRSDTQASRARLIMLFSKQVLTNPDEHEYLQDYYEEVARRFVAAIRESLQGISMTDAIWGYNYMVGILVFTLAGMTPVAKLPDELLRAIPADEPIGSTCERLTRFICAGLSALTAAR